MNPISRRIIEFASRLPGISATQLRSIAEHILATAGGVTDGQVVDGLVAQSLLTDKQAQQVHLHLSQQNGRGAEQAPHDTRSIPAEASGTDALATPIHGDRTPDTDRLGISHALDSTHNMALMNSTSLGSLDETMPIDPCADTLLELQGPTGEETISLPLPPSIGASKTQTASGATPRPRVAGEAKEYRFGDILGRGGMGVVRVAMDPRLRRNVAFKEMLGPSHTPEQRARFIQEAQINGQLEHPNIVPVYEYDLTPTGSPYFTMKRVRGRSLGDLLNEGRKRLKGGESLETVLPLGTRLDIIRKIADALGYAHSHRVIHRDLKPENIMVGEFGEVLVMDWGLAKILTDVPEKDTAGEDEETEAPPLTQIVSDRHESGSDLTMDGMVAGTPAYMSPEQAAGDIALLDSRTDIFSLGALLYEMLTLCPPYKGKTGRLILGKARTTQWEPVAEKVRKEWRGLLQLPPQELAAVAEKAMAPDPDDRYQTTIEFVADLVAFAENRSVSARPDSPLRRLTKWTKRNPAKTLSVFAGMFLVLAGVLALMQMSVLQARADEATAQQTLANYERRQALEETERANAREDSRVYEITSATASDDSRAWSDRLVPLVAYLTQDHTFGEIRHRDDAEAMLRSLCEEVAGKMPEGYREPFMTLLPADRVRFLGLTPYARHLYIEAPEESRPGLLADPPEELTFLHNQRFRCGGVENTVAIYRFEPFAWACGLRPDQTSAMCEFVRIPAGSFMMGSSDVPFADPPHQVTIGRDFFLARTEVVTQVWEGLSGLSELGRGLGWYPYDWYPANSVSWRDAVEWCEINGLRLPSEAEWEYACRAGTTTRYYFGDEAFPEGPVAHRFRSLFPHQPIGLYACYAGNNDGGVIDRAALRLPNAFGLFDMLGNASEYCFDEFVDNYHGAPTDGSARVGVTNREVVVWRGGNHMSDAEDLASASRFWVPIFAKNGGFRPVIVQD